LGSQIEPGRVRGYYIDMRSKAETPEWPPEWHPYPGYHRFIATAQWALGTYERYLAGDGQEWLDATLGAAEYLLETQDERGGWAEEHDYPATFHIGGPWLSSMAQGQCASLLVRAFLETGDGRFAAAARRGLELLDVDTAEGGVRAWLDGHPFPEEYPTEPAAFVLNGSIFSCWGWYDVWVGLDDADAGRSFREFVELLRRELGRWDTGYWSRYDLYPHPLVNVASRPYHLLHIRQLRALAMLSPAAEFDDAVARFEAYAASPFTTGRALAHKVAFRLVLPRNRMLRGKLPWDRAGSVSR
jgi:hypothetical protein